MSKPLFDQQNAGYVQLLYEEYSRNPDSVPESWRKFFSQGPAAVAEAGLLVPDAVVEEPIPRLAPTVAAPTTEAEPTPPRPTIAVESEQAQETTPLVEPPAEVEAVEAEPVEEVEAEVDAVEAEPVAEVEAKPGAGTELESAVEVPPLVRDEEATLRLLQLAAWASALAQSFREHGHQLAKLDPLGSEPPGHPQLDPSFFGTTMEEMEAIPAFIIEPRWGSEPLPQVLLRLKDAYCGSIGYEFEHLEDPEKVGWLWEQVEAGVHSQPLGEEERKRLLFRLSEVEGLEHFLHRAYLGQKRFSLEGTDMMVPMLDQAIEDVVRAGGQEVIIGMAHRGRLNVLAHLVGVSYREILGGFEGKPVRETALSIPRQGTGDVKYHHGAEADYELRDGSTARVCLAPNPSHLEFVNPVVEGLTRAKQFAGPEKDWLQDVDAVVPILIHGDAAFAAEGIVAETLNLARLDGYSTGGTLHLIANNQVGFTAEPSESRSTRYSSDLAKGYDIPVIHVNADDPRSLPGCHELGHGLPHAVPRRRGHRPHRVPEAWAQRGRRACLHPA